MNIQWLPVRGQPHFRRLYASNKHIYNLNKAIIAMQVSHQNKASVLPGTHYRQTNCITSIFNILFSEEPVLFDSPRSCDPFQSRVSFGKYNEQWRSLLPLRGRPPLFPELPRTSSLKVVFLFRCDLCHWLGCRGPKICRESHVSRDSRVLTRDSRYFFFFREGF